MKTKFSSQIVGKFTKNAILLAITTLALLASPGSRAAALCGCLRYWCYNGSGDWFVAANWCPNQDCVPGCAGSGCCNIDNGTTEADIDNTGTAKIARINGTPPPTAQACEVFIGKNSMDSGNLSVDTGTLDQCNAMWVGYNGKGTLSITNGGSVSTDGAVGIAAEAGSNGSATVDGTNSTWTFGGTDYVGGTINGAGGTGVLTVTNGGVVTAANVHVYKSGTLAGNGKVSTPNGGATTIEGTLAPNWTLTIDGDLTFSNTNSLMECTVTSANLNNIDAHVTGAATLTGILSVTVNSAGDFKLLHADGGRVNDSRFSSYSFTYNGCLFASVIYQDNSDHSSDVILHVVTTCN